MNVGFTGTRKGMSNQQRMALILLFQSVLRPRSIVDAEWGFHHGCAKGADTQAAELADQNGYTIFAYPPGSDPLARNRKIVSCSMILIAAPETDAEILRSGTWATVRYAREAGLPIIMLPRGK